MGELGYIRDKLDVKYLILFVMSCLDIQVTFDDVAEMAMIDNAMTYFDVSDAFYEMVESGHVAADGNYYSITERGRQVLTGYERRLPASVRRAPAIASLVCSGSIIASICPVSIARFALTVVAS